MYGISFCNFSEFSSDKSPFINKEAAGFGDREWGGKGHSYISNFGLDLHHRHFNSYYFKFILNSLGCILITLLLMLECKCEFMPLACFIPTLSKSVGIYSLPVLPCTFQNSRGDRMWKWSEKIQHRILWQGQIEREVETGGRTRKWETLEKDKETLEREI